MTVIAVSLAIALTVVNSRVVENYGDPLLSLLVSQSLLQNHTIRLDAYYKDKPSKSHHALKVINRHYYDFLYLQGSHRGNKEQGI